MKDGQIRRPGVGRNCGRFCCAVCGKRIGKTATHVLTETDVICCIGCGYGGIVYPNPAGLLAAIR